MNIRVLAAIAALVLIASPAFADQADVMNSGRRVLTAERLKDDERVTLDGILDEAAWKRATTAGEFIMQDGSCGRWIRS